MEDIINMAILDEWEDDDIDDLMIINLIGGGGIGNRAELYGNFDFHALNTQEAKEYFRFEKADIPRLARALNLPEQIILEDRHSVSSRVQYYIAYKIVHYLLK